ncbi:MAG: restriction endonuclease subunit S [Paracoccaceae bacterium]
MSFVARPDNSPTWADDLPEGWTADWVKWSVTFASAKPDGEDIEKLPYISNEDITSWTGKLLKEDPVPADKEGRLFRRGDVLFNKLRPYLAKVYHADFDGISSGELLNLRASEHVLPRFLFHVLSSYPFVDIINSESFGTKMPRADWETVGHQPLPLPDLDTQRRIAGYLDDKTARIDALIGKKRALLDRLAEKRQALITRAVTRGLNPDAPLKDSGIDWLGKVPAHWQVKRFRFLLQGIEQGWSPQCDNRPAQPDEWGVLKVGCVNGLTYDEGEHKALPSDLDPITRYEVRVGDVLLSRANTKELLGSASLVHETRGRMIFSDKLYRLNLADDLVPAFAITVLQSPLARLQYERDATGTSGSMQNIGQDTIKNFVMPIPPSDEQISIGQHVAEFDQRLTNVIESIKESAARLDEYRAALVTAAVTGKIKALLSEDAPKPAKKEAPAAFKRSVLAAYIADTLCDHPTFGRVKFQKLLHLCEAHLEIQEVAGNYHRDAAGPFDTQMMRSVHSQIEKQGWIAPVKGDKGWTYARGKKVDGYRDHFDRYFGDRKEALEDLLALIAPMKTQQAEIVSTAFAAWNDLLLEGKTPTDAEIVDLILNDWTESKKAISADRWHSALAWMREKGLTPRGLGEHTKKKG